MVVQRIACASLLGVVVLTPPAEATFRFSGELHAGQTYSKPLHRGLWFCLLPHQDQTGWTVSVSTSCKAKAENFAAAATPPFHGPNPASIDSWHFLPDARVFGNKRIFRFVLRSADYQTIMRKLNQRHEAAEILADIERLGRGMGEVEVLDVNLAPAGDEDHPRFVRIRFIATITLPGGVPEER